MQISLHRDADATSQQEGLVNDMSDKDVLFEINVIAGELKNLLALIEETSDPQLEAVLYFAKEASHRIEKLSGSVI